MFSQIVTKLKTGKIKNVVKFGRTLPAPPYVVVKEDAGINPQEIEYVVITHMAPGQEYYLKEYIMNDLSSLLNGFSATDEDGNFNVLRSELTGGNWDGIITNNDDGTISMERRFHMPFILF